MRGLCADSVEPSEAEAKESAATRKPNASCPESVATNGACTVSKWKYSVSVLPLSATVRMCPAESVRVVSPKILRFALSAFAVSTIGGRASSWLTFTVSIGAAVKSGSSDANVEFESVVIGSL